MASGGSWGVYRLLDLLPQILQSVGLLLLTPEPDLIYECRLLLVKGLLRTDGSGLPGGLPSSPWDESHPWLPSAFETHANSCPAKAPQGPATLVSAALSSSSVPMALSAPEPRVPPAAVGPLPLSPQHLPCSLSLAGSHEPLTAASMRKPHLTCAFHLVLYFLKTAALPLCSVL